MPPCPRNDCQLRVHNGKVYCEVHDCYLHIAQNWIDSKYSIPMHHVLYVAYSNGVDGEVLIDEEQ